MSDDRNEFRDQKERGVPLIVAADPVEPGTGVEEAGPTPSTRQTRVRHSSDTLREDAPTLDLRRLADRARASKLPTALALATMARRFGPPDLLPLQVRFRDEGGRSIRVRESWAHTRAATHALTPIERACDAALGALGRCEALDEAILAGKRVTKAEDRAAARERLATAIAQMHGVAEDLAEAEAAIAAGWQEYERLREAGELRLPPGFGGLDAELRAARRFFEGSTPRAYTARTARSNPATWYK
jgi:hypothetical protein